MNKNIYKDEFGQYHEIDEEVETPLDGFEDDEIDQSEDDDDLDDPFDSIDEDNNYDEDEEYANERRHEYDSDED
jgi:hypothetical protein